MEKRNVQTYVLIIFSSVLVVSALTGGNRETGEMGQIQDAMRSLRRLDSISYSYTSTVLDKSDVEIQRIDVWADQLSGSWTAEYYSTDEDGTVFLLRQYCDGRNVYNYSEWNGYWEIAAAGNGTVSSNDTAAPMLDRLTVLTYSGNDITDINIEMADGIQEISFTFTPEYLENIEAERESELNLMYRDYEAYGPEGEPLDTAQLTIEQYNRTELNNILVSYSINADAILCKEAYTMEVNKPQIVIGEDGNKKLGDMHTTELEVEIAVKSYNQSAILNKIEQCRNEM